MTLTRLPRRVWVTQYTVHLAINHTEGDLSNLPTVLPVIDLRQDGPFEDQGGIQEINAVLLQVCLALVCIPLEAGDFHWSLPWGLYT